MEIRVRPTEGDGYTNLTAYDGGEYLGRVQVVWGGSIHAHVLTRLSNTPELFRLRIAPHARGRGVARLLIDIAEMLVLERGYGQLGLAVGLENEAAKRLYLKAGFGDAGFHMFESPYGEDDNGRPYNHIVTYLVKTLAVETERELVVA